MEANNCTSLKLHKTSKLVLVDVEDLDKIRGYRWTVSSVGYVACFDRKTHTTVLMHRLILNADKGVYVDHINRNKLDNRKCNLRLCTNQQNGCNRIKTKSNTTSKYKGVHFVKSWNYWIARIKINYKGKHLGTFSSEVEAALAYNFAAKYYFGNFAVLNDVHI